MNQLFSNDQIASYKKEQILGSVLAVYEKSARPTIAWHALLMPRPVLAFAAVVVMVTSIISSSSIVSLLARGDIPLVSTAARNHELTSIKQELTTLEDALSSDKDINEALDYTHNVTR